MIDHTSYPHILDLIIRYAPRPSLLALRRVSRSLRLRADQALAYHLVLTTNPSSPGAAGVTSRTGALPALRRGGVKNCASLAAARVVDILGPLGYPRHPALSRLKGNVRVVRFRAPPAGQLARACVLPAPEIVVFTTVTERESGVAADTVPIPRGTRRAVLNVRYDPNRPWLAAASIPAHASPGCELVFVFTEKATHREPQVGGGVWPATRRGGMLAGIVDVLAIGGRAVLVDTQRLRPAWLGITPDMGIEEGIRAAVDIAVAERMEEVECGSQPSPAAVLSPCELTFLTRDEYRAAVGEETFALHTVE